MGKKSSDAAPPDPRLVDAQIRSMGVQEDAISQMLANTDRMLANSERLLPLQEEQMRFGIDTARQGVADARDDREFAIGRRDMLAGMQNQIVADAKSFNTEDRQKQLAGEAVARVTQGFDAAKGQAARQLARMNVNPNSGRMDSMLKQLSIEQALGAAGAGTRAAEMARSEGRALTDRATNALAGYPAMSMQASGQGTSQAGQGLGFTLQGIQGMQSGYGAANQGYSAAGNLAGQFGGNATSMWSAQGNYKNQADANAPNPLSDIASLAGTAAGAYMRFSARAYKQNIVRIGTHPAGFGIYEFEYREPWRAKGGAGRQVGVMADEVAGRVPGAVQLDDDGFTVVDYSML